MKKPILLGDNALVRRLCCQIIIPPPPISLSPSVFLPLSLSIYRHRQRSSPAAAITTRSNLFLSSPLLFTAGSRVTGLVAKKLEWRNDDSMGPNYTKIPYRI
ncbi:hypothetical protein MRB53_001554 [Persea americana]|uniref:Uncharacterized protein n=1 Tax=Persea americana TaxID=3435 RepID=A0ACC2MSZ8_PERAE|nr:hypothetical protein MRB53_001554 [Persea americana]